MIEGEQPLLGQRRKKLNCEKWIATSLFVNQLRQRSHPFRAPVLRFAVKRISNQSSQILTAQGCQDDFLDYRSSLTDRFKLADQWMGGIDFVVSIGADHHQVLHVQLGRKILEQVERGCVEPLQIVQKQRQRVLWSGEDVEESPEYELETALCVLGRKFRDWWLLTEDQRYLGDQVHDELSIRAQRLLKSITPLAQLSVASGEKWPDQAVEGLGQRRVGNVAFVLVELARGKKAALRDQYFVKLVDDGGLANPGISGNEYQFRPASRDHALEGGEQRIDFSRSSVQFFRNQQLIRYVMLPKPEYGDMALSLPFIKAALQIAFNACRCLVPFLGDLGQQLHYDSRERSRNAPRTLFRQRGLSGNVTVYPFHRVGCREGKSPSQHFVKGNSERIEIAPGIGGTIHSSSLLGCHVGEGPGD